MVFSTLLDTKILSSVNLQGETSIVKFIHILVAVVMYIFFLVKLSVAESYSTVSSPMTTEQNNMMRGILHHFIQ